jgi:hypothetical protein
MKITHPHIVYSDIPRLVKEGVIKVGTRVKACEDQKKWPNGLNYTLRNNMIGTISRISDNVIDISRDDEDGMIVFAVSSPFFLDILSDEEDEEEKCGLAGCTCKPSETCTCQLCSLKEGIKKDEQIEEPKKYGRSPFNQTVVDAPAPDIEKAERIVRDTLPNPLSFDEPLTKEAVGRVIVDSEGKRRRKILEVGSSGNALLPSALDNERAANGAWWSREQLIDDGWHFESSPEEISIAEAEKLTGKKIKR